MTVADWLAIEAVAWLALGANTAFTWFGPETRDAVARLPTPLKFLVLVLYVVLVVGAGPLLVIYVACRKKS